MPAAGTRSAPPTPRKIIDRPLLEAIIVLLALAACNIFAYALPLELRNQGNLHVYAAWVAMLTRVFLFHEGLLVGAIALYLAWRRRWGLCLATLPLIAFTLGSAGWSSRPPLPASPGMGPFAQAKGSAPRDQGQAITIMTANLFVANRDVAHIAQEVLATRPDALLLQEFTAEGQRAFDAALNSTHPHAARYPHLNCFGLAIYARRPFDAPVACLTLGPSATPMLRAVIRIADRPVALYNLHLLPPSNLEYVIEQRLQLAELAERLAVEPLPYIISGDFNFTSTTPMAARLRDLGLLDAHAEVGQGRGATWPVKGPLRWVPGIRLDQIWYAPQLAALECRTGTGDGSDHRPVVARIGLR